jgi:diguanylate cyclase (GGDEF)-like protein
LVVTGVEQLVELLADAVSVGLLVTSPDGRVLWANQALRDLVGADGEVDPAGLPLDGPGEARESPYQGTDGVARWLHVRSRRLTPDGSGGPLLYEIVDVTERHRTEEQALQRERRLSRVEALAKVGSWEWDLATDAVVWSDELLGLFGYPPGTNLDYHDYRALLHPEDVSLIEGTLAEALETGRPFEYTHRMYLADGVTQRVFECFGEVLKDTAGRPVRVLGTANDITEQWRVQAELAYLAEHDPLTSLPNRRSITAHLRTRLDGGALSGALLLVDVDDFKRINDLHGHVVGDMVLRGLAPLLLKWSDSRALLGRLGGDEFAIVLPDGDAASALEVAESLCDAIARHPFVAEGIAVRVTVSIGIAPLTVTREPEVLLANADLAMYQAKGAGKSRAALFDPRRSEEAAQHLSVLQRVHDALDGGLLALYAQPVADLTTGRITAHEVLLRLRDGLEPRLGPAEFLPAVERTDLMPRIDRWVVEQAVEALASPAARAAFMRLDVNLSSRALADPTFGDHVLDTLRAAEVEPARLGVEVAETDVISSLDAARALAERLTPHGCRFTLDDFGAGFGSFVYLKHLPFTTVKIAAELVRQADVTATDRVLVESAVRAARGLGMRTVAEHVDREALVTTLHELGVDGAQGFHLGAPLPLAEVVRRVQTRAF